MVPGVPAAFRVSAAVVMAWSAASAASGGKPYPQIAAVPASSRHSSTRGSFSASRRRFPAASGSAFSTARPIAARICPGVLPVTAPGTTAASAPAAAASSRTRVASAISCAL